MVLAGLRYMAAADPTAMAAQAQAECLLALEQGDAMRTAARARMLAAFTAGQGYSADADYSPTSWLIHRTKISKSTARGHVRWSRRVGGHPAVIAALAEQYAASETLGIQISVRGLLDLDHSYLTAVSRLTAHLPAIREKRAAIHRIELGRGSSFSGDVLTIGYEDRPEDLAEVLRKIR